MLASVPFLVVMPNLIIGSINPQAALLLVLFLLLLVHAIVNVQMVILTVKKYYWSWLFVALSFISLLWTQSIGESIGMTIKYLTPLLLLVMVLSVVRSHHDMMKCERAIIGGGLILIVLGVVNKLIGDYFDPHHDWSKSWVLVAPYMSPANYSFMLAMCALLALKNFLFTAQKNWLLIFIVFFVGVMGAFTRISMAGLLLASAILFGVYKRSVLITYIAPLLAMVLVVAAIIFIEPLRKRMFFNDNAVDFSMLFKNVDFFLSHIDTSGRSTLWQAAFVYFKKTSVWFGAGSGSTDFWVKNHTHALALHNDFLRVYFDLGVIGLVLFLLSLFQLMRVSAKRPRYKDNQKLHNAYKALAIAALWFYLMTLITDNTLNYVANIGVYVYAFIAFAFLSRFSQITAKK